MTEINTILHRFACLRSSAPDAPAWHQAWSLATAILDCLDQPPSTARRESLDTLMAFATADKRFGELTGLSGAADVWSSWKGFEPAAPPLELEGQLNSRALHALFNGEVNVVIVRGYAATGLCIELVEALLSQRMNVWTYPDGADPVLTDVMTIGLPAQHCVDGPSRRAYEAQDFEIVRRLCGARLSPLDQLRLDLDALWHSGATVRASNGGERRLAGIPRVYWPRHAPRATIDGKVPADRGPSGYVHVDVLPTVDLQMFSANTYLACPHEGGELEYFNVKMPVFNRCRFAEAVFEYMRNASVYRLLVRSLHELATVEYAARAELEAGLPMPLKIRPQAGDLVILNAGVPHGVLDFSSGYRASIQSFLKLCPNAPVRLLA